MIKLKCIDNAKQKIQVKFIIETNNISIKLVIGKIIPVISKSYVFSRSNELQHKYRLLFYLWKSKFVFNRFFFLIIDRG